MPKDCSTSQKPANHTAGPFELDHATDNGTRHFIVHGQLPQGLNAAYGYPICDSMNRHHCVSPEEDEANGLLFAAAWDMKNVLQEIWNLLTPGQQGCAGIETKAITPVPVPYSTLAKIKAVLFQAGEGVSRG